MPADGRLAGAHGADEEDVGLGEHDCAADHKARTRAVEHIRGTAGARSVQYR